MRKLKQEPCLECSKIGTRCKKLCQACYSKKQRSTPSCKLKLDSTTTDHVKIKALTNVLILPDKNKIDEEWDEIYVESGACIEFRYAGNHWYIMSSDGLKLPD